MKNFSLTVLFVLLIISVFFRLLESFSKSQSAEPLTVTFDQTAKEFHVPKELLETICYREGNMSNHNGYPSVDKGYGCMHLVKNDSVDTLDEAASLLHVDTKRVETDMTTNIRGGAAVLREEALQLSANHKLPSSLAGWYGAVAAYSHAHTKQSAEMYADAIYTIIAVGFSITSNTRERITLSPHLITPDKTTTNRLTIKLKLPPGCVDDGKTDYPGAIDCILDPNKYNCNFLPNYDPCTYEDANRPKDYQITFVAIHYFEAYLPSALALFHDPKSLVSIHYIVDTDGTIYQITREKDIVYHLGNYWYNQRSIGIEHTGFGPSGFRWFNAAEYLGSAKLTAYLIKKYTIPLDHDHIVAHGIIPSGTLASSPNHVDPGPYWQWDKYFDLIHQQGVSTPIEHVAGNTISIYPQTNYLDSNYFSLYTNPGTRSPLIPSDASVMDRIEDSDNVEADISYAYINKMVDIADPDIMLYQIWYGENDNIKKDPLFPLEEAEDATTNPPDWFANAKPVWLAVPKKDIREGKGKVVRLVSQNQTPLPVYGIPESNKKYIIGNSPTGAVFISTFTETETKTNTLWYEINYNHRQAWIPAWEIKNK